ncbi:MAG: hypothetical protein WAS33_11055 [Candidatus Promineifilaceae bacterium]
MGEATLVTGGNVAIIFTQQAQIYDVLADELVNIFTPDGQALVTYFSDCYT